MTATSQIVSKDSIFVQEFARLSTPELANRYSSLLEIDNQPDFQLSIHKWEDLNFGELTFCYDLVKSNLKKMYSQSTVGWSSRKKKAEMKEFGLLYILLRHHSNLQGFISFMITIEEDELVVYCYELHLSSNIRNKGLGHILLDKMESIGRQERICKTMLTVFSANPALLFYTRHDYNPAEHSLTERKLRNGTVKLPSYYILEKKLL
ncbi:hypothetical protein V1514DRAFT_33861 [Lipomyces japonicus]|uniref:uncharacterized protein n=1 Tax=Lipomyces japonicus TaxID=56871 RepID=UPI0034CF3BA3